MLQQSTNITYHAQVIHAADHKKIKHAISRIMNYFHFGKEALNTEMEQCSSEKII